MPEEVSDNAPPSWRRANESVKWSNSVPFVFVMRSLTTECTGNCANEVSNAFVFVSLFYCALILIVKH